jgi:hypothetical protein
VGETLLLVPDSGTSGFVMYARDGRTSLPLEQLDGRLTMRSLAGGQTVRTMMLRELILGGETLRNQRVALVERGPIDPSEGDGLLPLHIFASVSFNARERYITIRAK